MIDRVKSFALIGLVMGLGWSALIAVLTLLTGSLVLHHRHGDTPLYQLAAVLTVGFTSAGALTGVLLPLARRPFGAFCVGVVALAPYVAGLVYARAQTFNIAVTAAACVIIGGGAGLIFHRIFTAEGGLEDRQVSD